MRTAGSRHRARAESKSTRPATCGRVEDDVVGPGAGRASGDEAVAAVARSVGILVVREGRVAGEPVLVARPDHPRLDLDASVARRDRHAEVCDPAANVHAIHDFATREPDRKRRVSREDVGVSVRRDAGGAARCVAGVVPGSGEGRVPIEPEPRPLGPEPERDPPTDAVAGEDHEARDIAFARSTWHVHAYREHARHGHLRRGRDGGGSIAEPDVPDTGAAARIRQGQVARCAGAGFE